MWKCMFGQAISQQFWPLNCYFFYTLLEIIIAKPPKQHRYTKLTLKSSERSVSAISRKLQPYQENPSERRGFPSSYSHQIPCHTVLPGSFWVLAARWSAAESPSNEILFMKPFNKAAESIFSFLLDLSSPLKEEKLPQLIIPCYSL